MTVGIYHLVRKANGIEPFLGFIRSFRAALPAGPWRLVLIFKGFANAGEAGAYLDEVAGLPLDTLFVPDRGFDIGAYLHAAKATSFETCLFFNSFCTIREPRWFEIYTEHFSRPGVGLVGATGSLESVVRNHRIYGASADNLIDKGVKYAIAAGLVALFPAFPNAHIRTNAFMIRREHFLASHKYPINSRFASLVYESGRPSLTRQIQARGLQVLVVDREGRAHGPEAWAETSTFRSGSQDKVLVEDNRIREYADASDDRKRQLRWLAFG